MQLAMAVKRGQISLAIIPEPPRSLVNAILRRMTDSQASTIAADSRHIPARTGAPVRRARS
jgi:hypothetical protein